MKGTVKFVFWEIIIFIVMGVITLIEITNFGLFNAVFTYMKTPSSWFIGLSLAYAFSNFLQGKIFSYFKRDAEDEKKREDFFLGFIITMIITSIITPYLRDLAAFFFSNIFAYFHIIIMQSVIILYLLFKLKNNYEISSRYFLTNQAIVIFYTAIILAFM